MEQIGKCAKKPDDAGTGKAHLMSSLDAKMGDLLCSARASESLGLESTLVT